MAREMLESSYLAADTSVNSDRSRYSSGVSFGTCGHVPVTGRALERAQEHVHDRGQDPDQGIGHVIDPVPALDRVLAHDPVFRGRFPVLNMSDSLHMGVLKSLLLFRAESLPTALVWAGYTVP